MKMAKLTRAACLSVLAFWWAAAFGWSNELNGVMDSTLLSFQRSLAGIADPDQGNLTPTASQERGLLASDGLRGNGARAGYVLSHSGIVPGSECVTVDGSRKFGKKDYYLDCSGGTLMFAEPVRTSQFIRVTYRYVPGKETGQGILGVPTLALNLGPKMAMGMTYGYRPGGVASAQGTFDLLTYGVNLRSSLNANSTMTNMMYVSSPRDSGRVPLNALQKRQNSTPTAEPKSGRMSLHNSDLQFGRISLKTNFQEVGADFSGFASLREQKVAPEDLLARLEKEKGLRRLGFDMDYNLDRGASTGLGWNRIADKEGDIVRQSLGFANGRLKLDAGFQEVDEGFKRFNDLAEGERAQWAKERGIKRSDFRLSLAPLKGIASDSPWNALSWGDIADRSGKLSYRALSFAGKGFSLNAVENNVDEGFVRLGDLSEDERAAMALRIRQEFDPNAKAAAVTGDDRQSVLQQAGIRRRNVRGGFQFGSTGVGLQFLEIGSGSSGISRQAFSFEGGKYKVSGILQEIDADFNKLAALAPIERQHFANECGMRRMNLAGDFDVSSGLKLGTSFARVSAEDASLVKYGLSLKGETFDVKANFQNIDPQFNRVNDLADPDKARMAAEQGFKRWEVATKFRPSSSLKIDSYLYDAKHSTEDRFKRQLKNNIVFSPSHGPRLSVYRDEVATDASKFLQQTYKLEHRFGGLSFAAMHDTVTNADSTGREVSAETRTFHINSDPAGRISFAGDLKTVDRTDGEFEDAQAFRLNARLSSSLAFTGVHSVQKTDQNEMTAQEYGLIGKLPGGLNLAAKFGEILCNGMTAGKVRELSLRPSAAKDYGVFKGVNWSLKLAQVEKGGKIETGSKAARVESVVAKHRIAAEYSGIMTGDGQTPIVRSFSVAGDQDPGKRLHYALAYKVRDLPSGPSILIRRYNADFQMSPTTRLIYSYFSCNEKPDGTLEPIGTEQLKLTTALTKRLGLIGGYERTSDYLQNTSRARLSLGISGKLSSLGLIEASYGYDRVRTPSGETTARTYKMKYDYQVSGDQFLTFSGQYTDWSGPRPANPDSDDTLLQLDFRTLFN